MSAPRQMAGGAYRCWWVPLLIVVSTVAAFYPVLRNGFVNWDDDKIIVENPFLRGFSPSNIRWMLTTFYMGHYQPLTWLSLAADYIVWGLEPFGYHLTNLLIHCANAVLVYFIAVRLLFLSHDRAATAERFRSLLAAAFAGLVFAIHPLRVESVAWVTERRDVLAGFFLLCTILCYLNSHTGSGDGVSRTRWMVAAVITYILSLLSKASGMTLPVVLLLLDVYPLRRLRPSRASWFTTDASQVWLEKAVFAVPALLAGGLALAAQHHAGAMKTVTEHPISHRIAQAFYGIIFYLWKTVLPFALAPMYELPQQFNPLDWPFLLSGLLVIGTTLVLVWFYERLAAALVGWLVYLVLLVPTLGFAQSGHQLVADRYSYLPSVSLAVLVSAVVLRLQHVSLRQSLRSTVYNIVPPGSLMILLLLGFLSWNQAQIWHDSETLWRHVLAVNKQSVFGFNNLGNALAAQGKLDEAIAYFRDALQLVSTDVDARYNLGNALARTGHLDEAAEHLRGALLLAPEYVVARYDLALVLAKQGNLDEALAQFREALRLAPDDPRIHYNIGLLLWKKGEVRQAVDHLRHAIRLDPSHLKARYSLARALAYEGDLESAVDAFRQTLRVDSTFAEAHAGLARVLAAQGKKDEAVRHYEEAVRLLKKIPSASVPQSRNDESFLNSSISP